MNSALVPHFFATANFTAFAAGRAAPKAVEERPEFAE